MIDFVCASGYEPEGRVFESLRAHHSNPLKSDAGSLKPMPAIVRVADQLDSLIRCASDQIPADPLDAIKLPNRQLGGVTRHAIRTSRRHWRFRKAYPTER